MSTSLVPVASDMPAAPAIHSPTPAADDLIAALPERIEPVRRSRTFRLRLALAAMTLLMVLAIYLALIVVTSYGIWSHLASPGFVAAVRLAFEEPAAYIAFCIAGPILCVFLVKPIFTMQRAARPGVTLDRSAEPRLFAFVERLCAAQGAPAPRQIRVDTDVNASASLRHGLIGLFRDDLVLTVGMPLARTMPLGEFTGILAHEFGHFAHGGAMRLSYLIRSMIFFMLRVVHERDTFDEMLVEASRFRVFFDMRITLVLAMFSLFMNGVRAFLWLARCLLKGLAWVSLTASGALLREMEYDADRHEARVVGSATFVACASRLAVLGVASQNAWELQKRWWQSGRLADDLPALIAAVAERIAARPDAVRQIVEHEMKATTGRFDTHPALRDRFASVEKEAEPGAFRTEALAAVLFSDLAGLCRAATLATYKDAMSLAFGRALIVPVADLLYELEGDSADAERLARFGQGVPVAACRVVVSPTQVASPDATIRREDAARSLDAARQRVLELAPEAVETARRLEETRQRYDRFGLVVALIQAHCPVALDLSGAPMIDLETALAARKQAGADLSAAGRDLAPFSGAVSDRLLAALRVLHAPDVPESGPADGHDCGLVADPARCDALLAALAALDSVRADTDGLRSRQALIRGLLERAGDDASQRMVMNRAFGAAKEVGQILKTVRGALERVPYPYAGTRVGTPTGSDALTIGDFLGPSACPMDPAGAYNQVNETLSRLRSLEGRMVSSLVAMAERVETALGLPPLPDPPAGENRTSGEETAIQAPSR
jgi:Zn-dependent protease with chaperone function